MDPHYSYRLTRQTSDDLQFIARHIKIMIIVGLVMAIPAILFLLLTMGTAVTAIGGLIPRR